MRLQEIKDVRVGQIWSFDKGKSYDIILDVRILGENYNGDKYNPYQINYQIFCDLDYMIGKRKTEDKDNIKGTDIGCCRKGGIISIDFYKIKCNIMLYKVYF